MKSLRGILGKVRLLTVNLSGKTQLIVNEPLYLQATSWILCLPKFFSTHRNEENDTNFRDSSSVKTLVVNDNSSVSARLLQEKRNKEVNVHDISPGYKSLERYNIGGVKVTSFPPSFNFAAYVDDSPSLQELVKLGVNLYKWERRNGIMQFILQRDFFQDMAPYIKFLHDHGVPSDSLGMYLTKNPHIFKEELNDLQVRINYLESKKFTQNMISRVLIANPYWIMFSTKRIDRRLGHFQQNFKLSGKEVRQLAVKQPRLITYNMHHIKRNTFVLKEELGVNERELKRMLLQKPKLWMINQESLKKRFEYVHLEMKIPQIMPVPVGAYQTGPSCWDRMKMGFTIGFCVGMASGALFGGFSALRYGLRGRELVNSVGKMMVQGGGTFGTFMAIGTGIRC